MNRSPILFGQGVFQLYYQGRPVLNPGVGKLAVTLIKDTRYRSYAGQGKLK